MEYKQKIRLKNTLIAAVGGFILTLAILYTYYRGFSILSLQLAVGFCLIFWTVNSLVITAIIQGLNLRFKDPSMSLFQMYWASFTSAIALGVTTEVESIFYLLIILPMVFGVFRVPAGQFKFYAFVISVFLLMVNIFRVQFFDETINPYDSLVSCLTFSFCAFTLSSLCNSVVKLQDRLRKKNEELIDALQARSYFLANMSHEIRTPMNGVLGMLDITLREELSESIKRNLLIAKESSKGLLTVINDILDFSKIEAGKLALDSRAMDLHHFLEDLISPFKAAALKKGIGLKLNFPATLVNYIFTDVSRLRQILNNILGNAIKFTNQGGIELYVNSTFSRVGDLNNTTVEFSVKDSGIGIAEEQIPSLFDHFSQADVTTTRRYGGTGLGLAIAKNLCELMGGSIRVTSTLGEGSEFIFTVLVDLASKEDIDRRADSQTPKRLKNPIKILLVEDNIVNQEVAKMILSDLGAEVIVANHGREALEILSSCDGAGGEFQMIFMDCQMPILDGYETAHLIRSDQLYSAYAKTPIVALTANVMKADRQKCLQSGMNYCLAKPIDIAELSSVLGTWFELVDDTSIAVITLQSSQSEAQTWNKESLLKLVGGKQERINKLTTSFASNFDGMVNEILSAIENQDVPILKKAVHALKGSAANMQFESLAHLCKLIENEVMNGNFSEIAHLAQLFILEVGEVKRVLETEQ